MRGARREVRVAVASLAQVEVEPAEAPRHEQLRLLGALGEAEEGVAVQQIKAGHAQRRAAERHRVLPMPAPTLRPAATPLPNAESVSTSNAPTDRAHFSFRCNGHDQLNGCITRTLILTKHFDGTVIVDVDRCT